MFRNKGMFVMTTIGFALALATQVSAADCQKKIALQASSLGVATDASGTAEVRARDNRQRFKISIDARVPNGTTYVVKANGMVAGTMTIDLGDGELELNNNNGATLPAAVNPVCLVGLVSVTDGNGAVLLQGSF